MDKIRVIYGAGVANELVRVDVSPDKNFGLLGATGWVTNANYSSKKAYLPLFFINRTLYLLANFLKSSNSLDRLVSCAPLKRALSTLYTAFLPKGSHAFIYLSLMIATDKLDVNIHPTKREVRFLNEEEIIQRICDEVHKSLGSADNSRLYKTQTLLADIAENDIINSDSSSRLKRTYENRMVRTDAKERKITTMLPRRSAKEMSPSILDTDGTRSISGDVEQLSHIAAADTLPKYDSLDRERAVIGLNSVKQLRIRVREAAHIG